MGHRRHDPHHVAHLAAVLLSGQPAAEPHHVKKAVATAAAILDEAHAAWDEADTPPASAAVEPETPAQAGDETKQA